MRLVCCRLLILDCLYPRDPLQPARKKKPQSQAARSKMIRSPTSRSQNLFALTALWIKRPLNQMRAEHRASRTAFKMPRTVHSKQALLEQAAQASGAKAPPTLPTPHIAPLPEGFVIVAPVAPGPQTTQPISARAKAFKRPAPKWASSSSQQTFPPPSDPQPDPPTFWDYGHPSPCNPNRPPIGSHSHPYQRTSSTPAGKNTGKGKGTPTLTHADITNKGKENKGGKGQKGQKGPKRHKGDKGGKGPKRGRPRSWIAWRQRHA